MAYIGHPIVGDTLYNKNETANLLARQALHAYKLEFKHPITDNLVNIEVYAPDDMQKFILQYH